MLARYITLLLKIMKTCLKYKKHLKFAEKLVHHLFRTIFTQIPILFNVLKTVFIIITLLLTQNYQINKAILIVPQINKIQRKLVMQVINNVNKILITIKIANKIAHNVNQLRLSMINKVTKYILIHSGLVNILVSHKLLKMEKQMVPLTLTIITQ